MLRITLLVLLAAAAFGGVYLSLSPATRNRNAPDEPVVAAADLRPDAPPAVSPAAVPGTPPTPQEDNRPVRDVTPEGITAGPPVSGPLVRVAPPTPEPAAAAPPPPARRERLFNPLVAAAGTIATRDREITLAGVAAPGPEESCGEAAWPCGRMARAALRRFIRGRAIECEVPAGAAEIPDPAWCSVGGESLSEWLVAQGWAKRAGDAYAELEDQARLAGLGVWSARRPGAQPAEVASSARANAPAISDRVSGTP